MSNIPADVTEQDVKELFSTVGEVLAASTTSSGQFSVMFQALEDAQEAVNQFNTRTLDGSPMEVAMAADALPARPVIGDPPAGGAQASGGGPVKYLTHPSAHAAAKSTIPIFASPVGTSVCFIL